MAKAGMAGDWPNAKPQQPTPAWKPTSIRKVPESLGKQGLLIWLSVFLGPQFGPLLATWFQIGM